MANLTTCKDCGHTVSKKAKICPSCGVKKPGKDGVGGFTTFVVLSLLVIFLFNLGGPSTPSPAKEARDGAFNVAYYTVQGVKNRLKDPDSAKFGNVIVVETEKYGRVVCGEVNAKNGFGGYTGSKGFVGKGGLVLLEGDAPFGEAWNELCAGNKGALFENF